MGERAARVPRRAAGAQLSSGASARYLAADGPLARALENFQARPGQLEMAARIEHALAGRERFVAESGTGTGKTFAYLVPALGFDGRVLISTGTRNLQDQLFDKDLPLVRAALEAPVSVALLKGRANYLCLHRLQVASDAAAGMHGGAAADLARVASWAARTGSGDIVEVTGVGERSGIWPQVTSSAENCLGTRCADYDRCFVNRARRAALEADVVVINHHLFFADLVLREDGFGQLLPGADAVIFDEAHQLPEVASDFLSTALSAHQIAALDRDTLAESLGDGAVRAALEPHLDRLGRATADLRLALPGGPDRLLWDEAAAHGDFPGAFAALDAALADLGAGLEQAAPVSEGLEHCWQRCRDLGDRLRALGEAADDESVRWIEVSERGFVLRRTPLDASAALAETFANPDRAWIFTSATLAVGDSFAHFLGSLGLPPEDTHTARWDSPFDFTRRALLYRPGGLPDPEAAHYTDAVVDAIVPVLEASEGRAFVLFTSHRALRRAAGLLAGRIRFPLLVQGDAPRADLLARFQAHGHAVLLGAASFWEGVDVRGPALSCVVIDKLPFAAPNDPVLRARSAALKRAGRNAFTEQHLPRAVIALKQGAGRLIRDVEDRGVLVLCDPRLDTRSYGRVFMRSLPPMPVTRQVDDVAAFFACGEPA